MISGLPKAGNVADADRSLDKFNASGVYVAVAAAYNALIEGLSGVNQATDAFELFEVPRMIKAFQIHTRTWVIFMDALHLIEFGHKVLLLLFR